MQEDEPLFLFRGPDIVNLMTYWWQVARVFDCMQSMPGREQEADPMEDQEAMRKLRQDMADHLMNLKMRDDDTTAFENAPLLIRRTTKSQTAARQGRL